MSKKGDVEYTLKGKTVTLTKVTFREPRPIITRLPYKCKQEDPHAELNKKIMEAK